LSYLVHTQTDRQTKSGKNITSLAEVKIHSVTSTDWHHFNIFLSLKQQTNNHQIKKNLTPVSLKR